MNDSSAASAAATLKPAVFIDSTGACAARVRELLEKPEHKAGLTGPEIAKLGSMSLGIMKRAVDRLLFTGEIVMHLRHRPGVRGAAPHVYTLIAPKQ